LLRVADGLAQMDELHVRHGCSKNPLDREIGAFQE